MITGMGKPNFWVFKANPKIVNEVLKEKLDKK